MRFEIQTHHDSVSDGLKMGCNREVWIVKEMTLKIYHNGSRSIDMSKLDLLMDDCDIKDAIIIYKYT
jgi:hypothetical protein